MFDEFKELLSIFDARNVRCPQEGTLAEVLEFPERIQLAIKVGESQYREFKSALEGPVGKKNARALKDILTDVGRTLVAFANADGGELLIGVEDDGSITGVPHAGQEVEQILSAAVTHVHADTPLPSPRRAAVDLAGKPLADVLRKKNCRGSLQPQSLRCELCEI